MVNIKKIAKITGFGVGTVSRALNRSPYLVSEETREIILKAAKKYGYVKDASAQTLATGKTRDIGLVIPAIFESPFYNDFYIKLISGILDALDSYGYRLRVIFLREKSVFREVSDEIHALKLSGLILSPYCHDFFIDKEYIHKLKVPVVVLSVNVTGQNIKSVVLDDFRGGYDGTQYLIRRGHKDIAVIRGFRQDIEERYMGYKKALKDNGVKLNNDLVLQGDGKEASGYGETIKLLSRRTKPTAIFCLDDEMAVGCMRAVRKMGLKCPGNISVLGFDGMDVGDFTDPKLTTMSRPVARMGKEAVDLLLNKGRIKDMKYVKVNAELTERESCAAV